MKYLASISSFALTLATLSSEMASPPAAGQDAGSIAIQGRAAKKAPTLAEARRGFKTKLAPREMPAEPLPEPPAKVFRLVRYDAPAGKLAAYISPDPKNGKKNPAIVWITGGDCNSIGELWNPRPKDNDQTAAAFRKAGIITMFPSMRGGNDNPGRRESYLGEVDDILAAADYLAKQSYVDPERIYLGGHSTGGTMAMLVAEASGRFRAAFSFGPVDDVRGYGQDALQFDANDAKEAFVRSPGYWLSSVASPLFVFEGTDAPGNIESLQSMSKNSKNPLIQFLPVKGVSHFSILAPANELIARKILRDRGPKANIGFSEAELATIRP